MKADRHIVVVAGNYPAPGRQMYVFVQELVHSFIELGVKVTVVAPQSVVHAIAYREKILPRYSERVTEGGVAYDIYRPYTISAGNIKFLTKTVEWFNSLVLKRLINRLKPEILYSHFWSSALLTYRFASAYNLPLFVACGEGDDALEDMIKSCTLEKLRELASSVTGVISVSSENKRKCIEFGLCEEKDVQVFPNCVNTTIFHRKDFENLRKRLGIHEDDFVVGFVGGFTPRKGPDRLAKAISIINDSKIKVIFIGKPFPGHPFDFDCPGIIHKGPVDHKLLPSYLNCMDIFVMPTQKEGCCNAIVEALSVGLPVISSDGSFNDDILDEKNSIRLKYNDIEGLIDAIRRLKENLLLRQEMTEYSLRRHNQYSITSRAQRILEFIMKRTLEKCK